MHVFLTGQVKLSYLILLLLLGPLGTSLAAKNTIQMQTPDGLTVFADHYPAEKISKGVVLLCHQAFWSRGEYAETAPWLAGLGYTVVAIDQRSGRKANGIKNKTAAQARKKGLKRGYLNAKIDLETAIKALTVKFSKDVILVGSSYSAGLALRLAGERHPGIKAVAAFSPGEYFKPKTYVQEVLPNISVPTLITGSKREVKKRTNWWEKAPQNKTTIFKPSVRGYHGSRSLWKSKKGSKEYRKALQEFLSQV